MGLWDLWSSQPLPLKLGANHHGIIMPLALAQIYVSQCALYTLSHHLFPGLWGSMPRGKCSFSDWQIDFIELLPKSAGTNCHALTMICIYTGLLLAYCSQHSTANTTLVDVTKTLFVLFVPPDTLDSQWGTHVTDCSFICSVGFTYNKA